MEGGVGGVWGPELAASPVTCRQIHTVLKKISVALLFICKNLFKKEKKHTLKNPKPFKTPRFLWHSASPAYSGAGVRIRCPAFPGGAGDVGPSPPLPRPSLPWPWRDSLSAMGVMGCSALLCDSFGNIILFFSFSCLSFFFFPKGGQ